MDRDELSAMKLSKLRQMCKNNGLLVSGNKEDVVERLLTADLGKATQAEKSPGLYEKHKSSLSEARDAAIDRLISRSDDNQEIDNGKIVEEESALPIPPPPMPESVIEVEVLDAEVFVAEIEEEVEEISEEIILDEEESDSITLDEDVDPWTTGIIDESEPVLSAESVDEESQASITITLPSLSDINLTPKMIAAITAVVLILVAGAFTFFLSQDSSFQSRQLRYGDSMQFDIQSSSIDIQGDDMVAIFRDSAGGPLDDACGELQADITTGTGSIRIHNGDPSEITHSSETQYAGAVTALDAFGRPHLAAQKAITHNLDLDLTGKTWREPGTCGNTGWILSDNIVQMSTKSWTDIGDKELIRTDTDLSVTDSDGRSTDLNAVTFGLESISGLGTLASFVSMPLTPIDLYEFFGDERLTSGSSSAPGATWTWTVGDEKNDGRHGLVYPISMNHEEFDSCNGHLQIDLLVKNGVPWPVKQTSSIVVDKSQKSSNCGIIESSISDAAIPDGRITILMTMYASSSFSGNDDIDWLVDYTSKPGPGEDRPGTSTERSWGVAMPDESEVRSWDLEAALECLNANYSGSGAAQAIQEGGYIWKAYTKPVVESVNTVEWNLSWVTEDGDSGWTVVRERDGGCGLMEDEMYDSDESVDWNKEAIPETQTLAALESRILTSSRYPGLSEYVVASNGVWADDVEYGYRLSVTDQTEILDLVPVSLGDGTVNIVAQKEWTESNKDHTFNLLMDAENGRMLGWFHYST
jgi:hypothetical protein